MILKKFFSVTMNSLFIESSDPGSFQSSSCRLDVCSLLQCLHNITASILRLCKGVYTIQPRSQPAFQVYCDMETDGGGWTVFQRRMDGSVDFYHNWTDYQQGFGNLSGEFWLGLDKIHHLILTSPPTQLRVDMQDFEGNTAFAQYLSFSVSDSATKYLLLASGYYHGTAGDSFAIAYGHNGSNFRWVGR